MYGGWQNLNTTAQKITQNITEEEKKETAIVRMSLYANTFVSFSNDFH